MHQPKATFFELRAELLVALQSLEGGMMTYDIIFAKQSFQAILTLDCFSPSKYITT